MWNTTIQRFIDKIDEDKLVDLISSCISDQMADCLLVDTVSNEMGRKLNAKRAQGRGGWHTGNCSNIQLRGMLKEHVEKGDMIDVLNIAAMIYVRQKLYNDT